MSGWGKGLRPAVADDQELVEAIRDMRARGKSLQRICDHLNEGGVPTRRGGAMWRPSALQVVLGAIDRSPEARARHLARRAEKRAQETPTFQSWRAMMLRCYHPSHTSFPTYGGRGITVCARWHSFEAFHDDMGDRPAGRTLDRIDGDGDYEPSNCRWATGHEQRMNQRRMVGRQAVRDGSPADGGDRG